MRRPPPRPTLFPYTTLFRSPSRREGPFHEDSDEVKPEFGRRLQVTAGLQACGRVGGIREHRGRRHAEQGEEDRKSTRLNSSHANISYAVFCLKKKKKR